MELQSLAPRQPSTGSVPRADTIWPRNLTDSCANWHFSHLTLGRLGKTLLYYTNPAARIRLNTKLADAPPTSRKR
jgi:hypothetical protein